MNWFIVLVGKSVAKQALSFRQKLQSYFTAMDKEDTKLS